MMDWKVVDSLIDIAFLEDVREGDHTALSTIPEGKTGKAVIVAKDNGVVAGVELAERIYKRHTPDLQVKVLKKDGERVVIGEEVLQVEGSAREILSSERIVLNFMQRMSGIATLANSLQSAIQHTKTKLLDTRKTTPGLRYLEKWAVKIGGAFNHRVGLFDMILIKDNHIDFAGGVKEAVEASKTYLAEKNLDLKIEVEVRDTKELDEVLAIDGVDRVMLDNFSPEQIKESLKTINGKLEVEASGGINASNLKSYAETGVDFISMGALTHSVKSLDLSMLAEFN